MAVELSRSENTARTYANAMQAFLDCLEDHDIDPETVSAARLDENFITKFAADLKQYAANTEQLYLSAVTGFYEFLAAESLSEINLPRLRMLIKRRARRSGQRLPQFPKKDILKVLDYAKNLLGQPAENNRQRLQLLQDREIGRAHV